ncbi:MAG: hypothetical protein EKK45_12770 [Curvibacter sp.]|nr:MAG: hypothetical protein EKK45_12770 [Curvibacter sp.]
MNMDIQRKASMDARAFIHKMIAESYGWKVSDPDPDAMLGDLINLYLFDVQSSCSWMATVGFEQFSEVISKFREAVFAWQDARDQINVTVCQLVNLNEAKDEGDQLSDRESELLVGKTIDVPLGLFDLIALLAATSKMAFEPGLLGPSAHFMVIRYATADGGSFLRPFLLPAYLAESEGALSPEQQEHLLSEIIKADYAAHPEMLFDLDDF